jgi:hypothetical protein
VRTALIDRLCDGKVRLFLRINEHGALLDDQSI